MPHKIELKDRSYLDGINAESFTDIALAAFRLQYHENVIYRQFTDALHIQPDTVDSLEKIPFLPISFFKTHKVVTGAEQTAELTFESSGTTGEVNSKHYVYDSALYEKSLLMGFEEFYGSPKNYVILALLPSYLERQNASLVHMAKVLMQHSGHAENGFYLNEWDKLKDTILSLETRGQKVLLLGVTFALLDFATEYTMQLKHTIVMETGGMKGRREEWTRAQVHDFLKQQWGLQHIHSEYGMTELLSQAYATSGGIFHTASTMKVLVRDMNDPLDISTTGTGCLNVIDLSNIHSCCFIATDDIGRIATGSGFEVLGRVDHTALRGCSLMAV